MQRIQIAERAVAGLTFATGWVNCVTAFLPVSGCGRDRDDALNVMMMEAVERNSSVFLGSETLSTGCAGDVSPEQWRRFLPFSNSQMASRGTVSMEDPYWVAESLSDRSEIRFANGVSLLDGASHLIPAGIVYLGYSAPGEPCYSNADSNGCAAGDIKEDAILRGMLELIERDAFGIWWFNRLERPNLSFEGDDFLCNIADALAKERRTLQLIDLTHDLGVPVVAAVSADVNRGRIYVGCAAGTLELHAARKAAVECLGFWFWGKLSADPPSRKRWLEEASLDSETWLRASGARPISTQTSAIDLNGILSHMSANGFDPVVVDLTRNYFQIPVVRVIAEGLRSQMPRFAAGRLYDLPVRLGWLTKPRMEAELSKYASPL